MPLEIVLLGLDASPCWCIGPHFLRQGLCCFRRRVEGPQEARPPTMAWALFLIVHVTKPCAPVSELCPPSSCTAWHALRSSGNHGRVLLPGCCQAAALVTWHAMTARLMRIIVCQACCGAAARTLVLGSASSVQCSQVGGYACATCEMHAVCLAWLPSPPRPGC